ncbi:aspartyl/asparaginyl beta-hydroxylase domain-containing protein [Micromonospora sp. NPDC047620]|uniref:aspartyl/asparaginyl beta-hydroxylase domain-containing protein n=1 Tax=Micromonospora sp. NPDC047620 TaxID=3364251 RepID=UPI003716CE19
MLDFAASLLDVRADSLPSAVVVGLASNTNRGDEHWTVVKANMAWFSTSHAANPDQVLNVVLRAAGARHRLTPRDHAFTRPPPLGEQPTMTNIANNIRPTPTKTSPPRKHPDSVRGSDERPARRTRSTADACASYRKSRGAGVSSGMVGISMLGHETLARFLVDQRVVDQPFNRLPLRLGVGNQTRRWHEGSIFVFDDTVEHEAWNRTGETRTVLLFDFLRPGQSMDQLDDLPPEVATHLQNRTKHPE